MPAITAAVATGITALTTAIASTTAATTAAAAGVGGLTAAGAGTAGAAGAAAGLGTAAAGAGGISAAGLTGTLGTVGTIGSLAGTGASLVGNLEAAGASRDAERLRAQQAALIHRREQREAIRQAQAARAAGLNALAGTSGTEAGPASSAFGGLVGQSQGNLAYQSKTIDQNAAVTQGLFSANSAESSAKGFSALASGTGSLFGQLAKPNVAVAGGKIGKTIFDLV